MRYSNISLFKKVFFPRSKSTPFYLPFPTRFFSEIPPFQQVKPSELDDDSKFLLFQERIEKLVKNKIEEQKNGLDDRMDLKIYKMENKVVKNIEEIEKKVNKLKYDINDNKDEIFYLYLTSITIVSFSLIFISVSGRAT